MTRYANTKGRQDFCLFLKKTRSKHKEIGELLRVETKLVSNWTSGLTRPGFPDREAIEELTGIPALSWLTEKEQKERRVKLARIVKMKETTYQEQDIFQVMAARTQKVS